MDILDWLMMTLTGWYFRSQPQKPPGVYVLAINTQLTSSIWWGFRINKTHKDMTQNIIYSPWGRTRGTFFWKLNYYYLAWLIYSGYSQFFLIPSNLLFGGRPWPPVVKTLRFNCKGRGFYRWSQELRPYLLWGQNKQKNKPLELRKGLGG